MSKHPHTKFRLESGGTGLTCLERGLCVCLDTLPPRRLVLFLPKSSCAHVTHTVPTTVSLAAIVCLHSRHKAESQASPTIPPPQLGPQRFNFQERMLWHAA